MLNYDPVGVQVVAYHKADVCQLWGFQAHGYSCDLGQTTIDPSIFPHAV